MATTKTTKPVKARTPRTQTTTAPKAPARPRLRSSHAATTTKTRAPRPVPAPMPPADAAAHLPAPKRATPRIKTPAAVPTADGVKLALAVAAAALDKKAMNVEIIDLTGKADYTDFLVLMTGTSDRHVRALADGIQEDLTKKRIKPLSVEGASGASWILIDYGDVVAHVFQENTRSVYDIDGLWLDASRIPIPE